MEDKKCIEVLKELFVTDGDTHFEQSEREEQNDAIEYAIKAIEVNAELLKALKDITETLESCVGGSDPLHYEDVKDEIEKAESVIKKATKQKPI